MYLFSCIVLVLVAHVGRNVEAVSLSSIRTFSSYARYRGGSSISQSAPKRRRRQSAASKTDPTNSNVASLTAPGRACGFYLWDAPSALLYKWCNHLLKDRVYEGRGGRKFVLIEPGSILQLLYPSSHTYSPDRCVFCGGNFRDHVALKWSKHLYTPFDMLLDRDQKQGRVVHQENIEVVTKRNGKRVKISIPGEERINFVFHRRYVSDKQRLVDYAKNIKGKRNRERILLQDTSREAALLRTGKPLECRVVSLGNKMVGFFVPAPKEKPSATLLLVRQIVLSAVTSLVRLESYEESVAEAAQRNVPVLPYHQS